MRKLEELTDFEEGYAISRPSISSKLCDAIPTELGLLLSALAVDGEIAESSRNISDLGEQSFTFASADLLAATIRKRLADYKTTISDDDDLLRNLDSASGAQIPPGVDPNRYRMAIHVRKGEKEILQQVLQLALQFITSCKDGKRKQGICDEEPKKAQKTKK